MTQRRASLGLKHFPKIKIQIGPSLIKYSLAVFRQNISTSGFRVRVPQLHLLPLFLRQKFA